MNYPKLKCIFIGCGYFGLQGLLELLSGPSRSCVDVVGVLSASGAGSQALRRLANLAEIPVLTAAPASAEALEWVHSLRPDLGIMMEYAQKLPSAFLERFARCVINFHPSDLPRFRGGAPLESLITESQPLVVSCHLTTPAFDNGPILGKTEPLDIEGMGLDTVYRLAAHRAVPLLRIVLLELVRGRATSLPQDEAQATYRHYRDLAQALEVSAKDGIAVAMRKLQAGNPRHGVRVRASWHGRPVILSLAGAFCLPRTHQHTPGSIVHADQDGITIALRDGFLVSCTSSSEDAAPLQNSLESIAAVDSTFIPTADG